MWSRRSSKVRPMSKEKRSANEINLAVEKVHKKLRDGADPRETLRPYYKRLNWSLENPEED